MDGTSFSPGYPGSCTPLLMLATLQSANSHACNVNGKKGWKKTRGWGTCPRHFVVTLNFYMAMVSSSGLIKSKIKKPTVGASHIGLAHPISYLLCWPKGGRTSFPGGFKGLMCVDYKCDSWLPFLTLLPLKRDRIPKTAGSTQLVSHMDFCL